MKDEKMTRPHTGAVAHGHSPLRRALLAGAALAPMSLRAWAQGAGSRWVPDHPLRLIVPFPAGGATDLVARLLTDRLKTRLGQPIVVDNRGGANGIIATRAAASAPPDGYTLFLGAIGTQAINPYVYPRTAVDPDKFVSIAAVNTVPTVFAVLKDGRVKSIDDVVKLGRSGQGNYGHWAVASVPHIAGEILKKEARIPKLEGIQYQGAAQCLQGLLGQQIDIANLPLSLAKAQSDRLKILGLASTSRLPSEPEIPTMAEIGYPVDIEAWYGVFAPPGTSRTIVDSLSADINATIAEPDFTKRLYDAGLKPQSFPTAEAYQAWIQGERTRWTKVLREIGVEPQ
jgi:tripartite-type tricarboxylate transporter receptor subunit TctC